MKPALLIRRPPHSLGGTFPAGEGKGLVFLVPAPPFCILHFRVAVGEVLRGVKILVTAPPTPIHIF